VRRQVLDLLNNYVRAPRILHSIQDYIVAPWLGSHAGALGALALAQGVVDEPRAATGASAS
jgi:hypothetical protein